MRTIEVSSGHTLRHGPRGARARAHHALGLAREVPIPTRYQTAQERVKEAGTSKKSAKSGFRQTLRGIGQMMAGPYDSWMDKRDVTAIIPSNHDLAYTVMQEGVVARPVIDLGPTERITDIDKQLLRYVMDVQSGERDISLFFPYVAALGYDSQARDFAARAERAKILDDGNASEYERKSTKAALSADAIHHTIEKRAQEDPNFSKEKNFVEQLLENVYFSELAAVGLDPRLTVTFDPADLKADETLTLYPEVQARALSLMYRKLDRIREQLRRPPVDTSKLVQGTRERFEVTNVESFGVEPTDYSGVLQDLKDFLGFEITPFAPALVLLTDENRQTHAQSGSLFNLPPAGTNEVVFNPAQAIIYAPPEKATREGIARAGAAAYLYEMNPFAVSEPKDLWQGIECIRPGNSLLAYRPESVLCEDVFTAGFTATIGIQLSYPKKKAQAMLMEIMYGENGAGTDENAMKKYLESKLRTLQRARELLLRAQKAPPDQKTEGNMYQLFAIAQTLHDNFKETLGVFYVHSILNFIHDNVNGIEDETKKNVRFEDWLITMLITPPGKLEDFLHPELFIERQLARERKEEREIAAAAKKLAMERLRAEEFRREQEALKEPSYPFRNLKRLVHWTEERSISIATNDPDVNEELHVPHYYHGTFSPVITPTVINEYAALVGNQFLEGTAERVTQALFGMFNLMDSDIQLQTRGNEPHGYNTWDQAGLSFIRFSPLEEPLKTYQYANGISSADVASALLAITQTSPGERPVFQRNQDEPLLHEQLLNDWFFSLEPSIAKLGTTVDVGITRQSIQRALNIGSLSIVDGILPDTNDQAFLRSLIELIPDNKPNDQIPQGHTEATQNIITEQDFQYNDELAELPLQEIMTEFERTFRLVENPLQTAEIPGFGVLQAVPTGSDLDPIITSEVLMDYSRSRNSDAITYGCQQARNALFDPFEEIHNEDDELEFQNQIYPESFINWRNEVRSLGFVLFPNMVEGRRLIEYGFRLSNLVGAMRNTGDQLQALGFEPEAQEFLTTFLSDLAYSMHQM